MREKFFSYGERVSVYTEGTHAFKEGTQRGFNPYVSNKDLAGLWWHGWDRAEQKSKGERPPFDKRPA